MSELNKEVGIRIAELRRQRGFTREKLAELSDISVQFLADIEKGRKSMTVNTLRKIASALICTADFIIYGNSEDDCKALTTLYCSLSEEDKVKARKILSILNE